MTINVYLLIINILSFIIMGIDKLQAIRNRQRISEISLLFISLIGGSLGTLLSMFTFRHKTKKAKFIILIPLFLIISIYLYTNQKR